MERISLQFDFESMARIKCNPKGETESTTQAETPFLFITTYSKSNPNLKEIISKNWSFLDKSSATKDLEKHDLMITHRKPPSLKDLLVKAKTLQPSSCHPKGCKRPHT